MSDISSSVGENGANAAHDVALVQLFLRKVKNVKGVSYFQHDYSGVYSTQLKDAIAAFQADSGGKPDGGAPDAGAPHKTGLIEPRSATWAKLIAAVPTEFKNARTLPGVKIVYIGMSQADHDASVSAIRNPVHKLGEDFKFKVVQLVQDFYRQSQIVLTVNDYRGWWRSFDEQLGLVSDGGPGESIHNYGYAVDIGFKGLRWVSPDGQIQPPLNNSLSNDGLLSGARQLELWAARNRIAIDKLHLFPTVKKGDLTHIQAFEDDPLDSAGSLVALMEVVGPRKMKWQTFEMRPTSYLCDLGLGGDKYLVGTATVIWDKTLAISLTKADLAKALNAKLSADPKFSVETFLGVPFKLEGKKREVAPDSFSDAHMAAVKKLLRAEFQAASEHWKEWKPVRYPDTTRRPYHRR
jgi:peptidoglycan hydrolase-like protein with peptidoglycan-binding domain